jgi:hypothetical protein
MHDDSTHTLRAEIKPDRSLAAAPAPAKRGRRCLGMPEEAQSREPLGRFLGETQIAANEPERAEREGQGVALAYEIGRSLLLDTAAVTQGGERIQPRRGVVDSEGVTTPGEERKYARNLVEIAADEGESQQCRLALRWPSDHRRRQCRLLEPSRVSLLAAMSQTESTDKK